MGERQARMFRNIAGAICLASLASVFIPEINQRSKMKNYVENMSSNYELQLDLEEQVDIRRRIERQNKIFEQTETDKSLAELYETGITPDDYKPYHDPGNVDFASKIKPHIIDASALKGAAGERLFTIKPQTKDQGSGLENNLDEWISPEENKERGHRFALKQATLTEILNYNRETSHIVPRGKKEFGADAEQRESDAQDVEKESRALIMVDNSGSMYKEDNNWTLYTHKQQTYNLFKPAILAMTIAQYYIQEKNTQVSGFSFSTNSYATEFTRSLDALALHYSQLECGGTEIDYELVSKIVAGTNSSLDVYIITDNDILSTIEMKNNLNSIHKALGDDNDLNRVFFIEWRPRGFGYNAEKENILKQSPMEEAYYGIINGLHQIPPLIASFDEKIAREN